jgi:class 3 adenylate cyclase
MIAKSSFDSERTFELIDFQTGANKIAHSRFWKAIPMAEERRRLAAVLAADVVGYSRLMEQDESDTLATLKAWRKEVLEPLVTQHQGRIFKFTGDGVLVEFGSAVNAVQCAINLQHGMAAANANIAEARQMVLRIGVNLGDVMVEGDDLYGDGINIAARLEGMPNRAASQSPVPSSTTSRTRPRRASRTSALKP